uniref:Uncharacterized protein n=1 Tax=Anguilla anguilla TaxID=7936 RepID=A0A0E9WRM0_ANGAN
MFLKTLRQLSVEVYLCKTLSFYFFKVKIQDLFSLFNAQNIFKTSL